jgi:D-arginine dehydrogenase
VAARTSSWDVAVIGGGIAGISIAYELSAAARVLVLEAETTRAAHTTGRSAALYIRAFGPPAVRLLTAASEPEFPVLQARHELPDLLTRRGLLVVATDEPSAEALAHGSTGSAGDAAPRLISTDETLRLCPALRADRLLAARTDPDTMNIDVMALHSGYLKGFRLRGGRYVGGARVRAIEHTGSGWRLDDEAARSWLADWVVDAAGAWADVVARLADVRPVGIRPARRTLFTSPTPWRACLSGWPAVGDACERWYFKPEGEHVLVSPADETPSEPCDARPRELDIALALERVNEISTLGLRSVQSAWAGLRSFVQDREPVVGQPAGAPGFFFFAGQGGYGVQMAPALARAGAGLLLDGRLPSDLAQAGLTHDALAPERLTGHPTTGMPS